jgi:hypothetical protein
MESAPVDEAETTPLAQAVDGLSAALDQLIEQVDNGGLQGLDANEPSGSCRLSRRFGTRSRWWTTRRSRQPPIWAWRTPCVSGP